MELRDVDPAAYDGVWAIIDDGCNSCSYEAWRQNDEATMKVLCLTAQKGDYLQRHRKEHEERKIENSHECCTLVLVTRAVI